MNPDQPRNLKNNLLLFEPKKSREKWIEKMNKTNTGGEMCHFWCVYGYRSIILNEF